MASGIPCSADPQNNDLLFFSWSEVCLISSCGLWRSELRFKKHSYEKFNSLELLGCYKNVGIPKWSLQILGQDKNSPSLSWLLRLSLAHCPDRGSWGNFLLIIHTSRAFHKCPPCCFFFCDVEGSVAWGAAVGDEHDPAASCKWEGVRWGPRCTDFQLRRPLWTKQCSLPTNCLLYITYPLCFPSVPVGDNNRNYP